MRCPSEEPLPGKAAVVRVGRETKGRRGKGVTVVSDLPLAENGLLELPPGSNSSWAPAGRSRIGGSRFKATIAIESSPRWRDWAIA